MRPKDQPSQSGFRLPIQRCTGVSVPSLLFPLEGYVCRDGSHGSIPLSSVTPTNVASTYRESASLRSVVLDRDGCSRYANNGRRRGLQQDRAGLSCFVLCIEPAAELKKHHQGE